MNSRELKAKPSGFYQGLKVLYHPEELDGLPAHRFVEALKVEGAPISGPDLVLEHLLPPFMQGFDLWGHGRGPLGGAFMGLPPFEGYRVGDLPVAEGLVDRVLTLPPYIEPKDGFLDQYIGAFKKVALGYRSLL